MRLEKASYKAIKYACLNFHYAKAVPNVGLAFNVYNDNDEWCGVICYGLGAANNIAMPFGLNQGQVIELLRMALNGKQESTTKAMAISLKILSKYAPSVKMVVSFADSEQGHIGTIYQATNWHYIGYSTDTNLIINGKREHRRTIGSRYGTSSIEKLKAKGLKIEMINTKPKWKYIYPIDKGLVTLCKSLSKPYPKKSHAEIAQGSAAALQVADDCRTDLSAQKINNAI